MSALTDRTVFRVDGVGFTWGDVALSAEQGGGWKALERRAREGWACLRHLALSAETEPTAAVAAEAEEFRYRRDLVSGDDAEEWLARRDLSIDDWMLHIRRTVLRRHWASRLEDLMHQYPAPPDDLDEILQVDAVCTEEASALAKALAGQAAAAASIGEPLAMATPAARRTAVEQGLARFRAARVSSDEVQRAIAAHRMEWIRLDCQALGFEEEAKAREAILCMREDGLEMAQVAGAARAAIAARRFYLDEIDGEHRSAFLAARVPDLVGPLEVEGRHTVFQLLDKVLPTPDDPDVQRRAEALILQRAIADEMLRRVRWEVTW